MAAMNPTANESDGPGLDLLVLARGPWRAAVFDPRSSPAALGARYVHGGYVQSLWHGDRCLTARANDRWDPYVGEGLPEVFELPLGFAAAAEGEPYLRIGAGRLIRTGRGASAGGLPATPVAWEVVDHSAAAVTMACRDAIEQGGKAIGYELVRSVCIEDDGLSSTTRLTLHVPWSHPMGWFAHPFFAQTAGDATGFALPGGAEVLSGLRKDGPLWRLPADGGLGNVVGLWGSREAIGLALDPALGGGRVELTLDRPLDHLVVYASRRAASPEPQLARAFKDGETASWTLRYRFDLNA